MKKLKGKRTGGSEKLKEGNSQARKRITQQRINK
jgi:hypothetical protein